MKALWLLAGLTLYPAMSAPLEAQATWGGLRFGMTPAQVKALAHVPMHEASGVENVRDFPYALTTEQPVYVQRVGFTASFAFDDQRRLQMIVLMSQRNDPALNDYAARHFAEALSGKYGPPVVEKAACEADDSRAMCRATWRDGTQRITLAYRVNDDHSLAFLTLIYEPNPSDL